MQSERTKIEFDYGGKHYTLMYTGNSLKKLEQNGVNFSKLQDMIFTAPETIFRGAFYAKHPDVSTKTIKEIYAALKRTAEDAEPEMDEDGNEVDLLTKTLGDMLSEAANEFLGRGAEGNLSWKVT